VGPTDLLLVLFFEVDTGIMEVEVLGSRDLPGVWNACAIDLGLVGEEGLDLACELAVGKAKPIDFRGFGVSGVDEGPEKSKPRHHVRAQKPKSSEQCSYLGSYRSSRSRSLPSLSPRCLPSVESLDLLNPSPSPSTHQPVCSLQWMTE